MTEDKSKNINLQSYTLEELNNEIERRKNTEKPLPLRDIETAGLVSICMEYIDELNKGNIHGAEDLEHYIFEAAIESVYGAEAWDWINKK